MKHDRIAAHCGLLDCILPHDPHDKAKCEHCSPRAAESTDQPQESMEEMLIEDNKRMREAGCELAAAALYTIGEYDGLHRLSLAVSKWAKSVADESGRPHQKDRT